MAFLSSLKLGFFAVVVGPQQVLSESRLPQIGLFTLKLDATRLDATTETSRHLMHPPLLSTDRPLKSVQCLWTHHRSRK